MPFVQMYDETGHPHARCPRHVVRHARRLCRRATIDRERRTVARVTRAAIRPHIGSVVPSGQRLERRVVRTDVQRGGWSGWPPVTSCSLKSTTHLARRILHVTEEQRLLGQTTTHAGSSPSSTRCEQKLHFAAVFESGSMYSASYGQLAYTASSRCSVVVEIDEPVRPR